MESRTPDATATFARDGFGFVDGARMRELLAACGPLLDWDAFRASWNDLAPDRYLEQVGRRRRRRHAVFRVMADGGIVRAPHQPHYQSTDYNRLQGDIERWFEPIAADIGSGATMRTVLEFARDLFGAMAPQVAGWHVEAHQFRIEPASDQPGEPTPEGVHRDGVDYVLVLMVDRHNIASGTTTIHSADGTLLGSFTLAAPFDAALVDDARVFHGVTPVTPLDPAQAAHRDVLVVTFRRQATP